MTGTFERPSAAAFKRPSPADECPIFINEQRMREAERDDAVCDLPDLLGGMGLRITRIGPDLADRQRFTRKFTP